MDDIKVYASTSLVETSTGAIGDDLNAHKNDKNNPHEVTAAQARALALDGSNAMTGTLRIQNDNPHLSLDSSTSGRSVKQTHWGSASVFDIQNYKDENNYTAIRLRPESSDLKDVIGIYYTKGGVASNATVLHTGNVADYAQPKITGTVGQFLVIGSDGNVTTKTINSAEGASF